MTDKHTEDCAFCKIACKALPTFVVYEDALCIAFLDMRQVRPGHTMVIPKQHIEHFMDVPDDLSAHIMSVAQRIARKIKHTLAPPRVGYVVSGFGVAHAHFHVQPLWEDHDITSQRYLDASRTPPVFDIAMVPVATDAEKQKIVDLIKIS